jgi:hypothetical protein
LLMPARLGMVEPPERNPGGSSPVVTAGSLAVRLPPCEGGGEFGDEPCDRRGYSRVVGWCGNGWFGWPNDAHHSGHAVWYD